MAQKRRTNIYKSGDDAPFNVSRSKIALFLECPQCFWLDRKLGIARPDSIPFNLNNAVDHLFKKEFDVLREQKQPHRLMLFYRIPAIPFWHPDLHIWRDDFNKKLGAITLHKETNLNIHGIIDDMWQDTQTGQLYIVDYKATSTDFPISLDGKWKEGYKRQMEVYQWIFRRLGFDISETGYFVFANASKNKPGFHNKLEFENTILEHQGNTAWIEPEIFKIKECLESEELPEAKTTCQYCNYRKLIKKESFKNQLSFI
ncbi:MAG TPA: PD-(D/E)XK nuclease family protein [Negativicutes bacterium]|nr:PD-(D/E)XK nuclease family protein [Negativicutes bacterium]